MSAITLEGYAILAELKPLFEQAKRENKWFWCAYQNIWFSPTELMAHQAVGQFIWSAVNWKLRDPKEMLAELRERAKRAEDDVCKAEARLLY